MSYLGKEKTKFNLKRGLFKQLDELYKKTTKYAYIPQILAIFFSTLPSFSMGFHTHTLPPPPKKNCSVLLEALKRMLLVKRRSGGKKMMPAKNKFGQDLNTQSLHPSTHYSLFFVTVTTTCVEREREHTRKRDSRRERERINIYIYIYIYIDFMTYISHTALIDKKKAK